MDLHPQARFIVDTLNQAGFIAYYAGGWVRDYLLKHPSDDIDIATNAPPETVQALFAHTVPVGIAFGIILVIIDHHQYEVATFRRDLDYHDGRRPSKIAFANAVEDAKRRDFTINGMFYDPITEQIFDYVKGQEDLKAKIIRAIGNPHERIREDRLRMIRAVRLSCRFHFAIEEETAKAIHAHAKELFPAVAVERIWQELTKGHAFSTLHPMLLKLHEFHLLGVIFPKIAHTSLDQIRSLLNPLRQYPKEAPVIAFILPLFPHDTLDNHLALCERMKLSNADQHFVEELFQARSIQDPVSWVHFYARPQAKTILAILNAHASDPHFLSHHHKEMERLAPFIERVRTQNPIVKAEDLIRAGVRPGPAMGRLLKQAEKLAIEQNITDAAPILAQLKQSSLWVS